MVEELVNVQPMGGNVGQIFNLTPTPKEWSAWRSTLRFWPSRSITGKFIFGRINKRGYTDWVRSGFLDDIGRLTQKRIHEYATNRELFEAKLRGETGE